MFNGIVVEKLDTLKQKNDFNLASILKNKNMLLNTLSQLNVYVEGSSLNYLLNELNNEENNIKKIPDFIRNYSDVLIMVKNDYQRQVEKLQIQINRSNSKLNREVEKDAS